MEGTQANNGRSILLPILAVLAGLAILSAVLLPRFLPMPVSLEPREVPAAELSDVKAEPFIEDMPTAPAVTAAPQETTTAVRAAVPETTTVPVTAPTTAAVTEPPQFGLTIVDGGQSVTLKMNGGTAADALAKAGITLGSEDILSCGLDDPVEADQQIEITRVTRETVEIVETIPYDVETRETGERALGENLLLQKGEEGRERRVYEVVYHNGSEYSSDLLESEIEAEPVTEIIEIGLYHDPIIDKDAKTISLWDGTVIPYNREVDVTATAYSSEGLYWKWTKLETLARVGAIAVDPRYIPLNAKLYVIAPDGSWSYGLCFSEDTGRLIKGYRIDLYFDTQAECEEFGRKKAQVYILPDDYEMPEELLPPDNYAPRED